MRTVITVTFALGMLAPAVAAAQVSGEAVYQQRCAVCHESGNSRVPPRGELKKLSVSRILRVLDFGEMQNVKRSPLISAFPVTGARFTTKPTARTVP
jgi:hypothetical protein